MSIAYDGVAMTHEDCDDIESYIVRWSSAGPSIDLLRPYFPRWRQQLFRERSRASFGLRHTCQQPHDWVIQDAMPNVEQNRSAMHDHRNLLWAVGAPMLRERGWKP